MRKPAIGRGATPSSNARNQQHDNKARIAARIALDQKVVFGHRGMSLGRYGKILQIYVLRNTWEA